MTSKIKVDNIADQDDNNIINESGDVITVGAAGDTVAVAGNIVKSNAYQASDGGNIASQSGTTITLGASGDTVTLASGASQSGFGREGSVDWQTTIKTGDFTAVSGEGYFINTTSGAITMTLPSSPSVGDIVAFKDYANTFDTNNLTIGRAGSNISGDAIDPTISVEGQSLTLVYGDATKGWQSVAASTEADLPKALYVTATGGTITTSGDFKIHTFTGPGTFAVSCAGNLSGGNKVDYLVVGGGAGGGGGLGGGGGAGGYRESPGTETGSYTVSPLGASPAVALVVPATSYPITVGAGGAGRTSPGAAGTNGGPSVFSSITSTGGGGGGTVATPPKNSGADGGSGGGGGGQNPETNAGSGNNPPTTPPQGNNGGVANPGPGYFGGGGGGALEVGRPGIPPASPAIGVGGAGATSSINGTPTARAGGGAGAGDGPAKAGGAGGGGAGGAFPEGTGTAGTANTGGGGGGGGGGGPTGGDGGAGGSGIVIIRYKFQN